MITKKSLPSLRRRPPPPRHVLGHTGLADIDAELQKLAMDSRRSPRIVEAHLADQPANFQRHDWSTAAAPRFPAPVRFKSSAVPTDHSVWPDNCQCIIDIGKQSADPSQYQSVNRETWEFLGTSHSARRFTPGRALSSYLLESVADCRNAKKSAAKSGRGRLRARRESGKLEWDLRQPLFESNIGRRE